MSEYHQYANAEVDEDEEYAAEEMGGEGGEEVYEEEE